MNRIAFFGTLILATAAVSAFADDITIDPHPFVSSRTQAEVQAELAQYKQAGVNPWSASYNPLKTFRSAKTHAQVEQEYLAARDEVRAMTAEDSGSSYLAQHRVRDTGSQLAGQAARPQ
ncbi:hypothetical protein GCM10028796_07410 [Ramlibacter monticola]|uniref:DUF4148 domain-containing protein n=1 Tax=Ramlibacter monticola TaxID=1926872 RepID=A0A936YX40_9BURK|nr:DUF4148 domain-containing protein [Ramlibacter monticola]MBL0389602.1 DUF4148 domain-containing protein [Ramlibacter monticola]